MDIRFNQSMEEKNVLGAGSSSQNPRFSGGKAIKFILAVILIAAIAFAAKFAFDISNKNDVDLYSAVFLSNGQVYFGKMIENNNSEIILNNVFYLQLSDDKNGAQSELAEPKFSLIKLGNELHGPTDEMFIKTSQVLFYENLRDDSRVVQSIKNYKQ